MSNSSFWLLVGAFTLAGAASLPQQASAQDAKAVARLWKSKCASCHGKDGKGDTKQGRKMGISDMTVPAWQKEITDEKMKKAMNDGIKREKDGKTQKMKSLKGKLTPEEMDALIAFVRTLK